MATLLVACGAANAGLEGPTISGGPPYVKLVGYEKSPLGDLAASVAAGQLVAVRYDGKTLARVACSPPATYKWTSTSAHRETLESESADDFRAKLPPIEGVSLDALTQFQSGNAVRIETVSAGMWRVDGAPSLADCKGATHYVSSITTGAYAMSIRQHATWTFPKNASSKGGDPASCTAASDATAPPESCAVAVGVSLTAVAAP